MTTPQTPTNHGRPARTAVVTRLVAFRRAATTWLARNSIGLLQISLGSVFFGFGALKFFSVSARLRAWRSAPSKP